MTSTHDDIFSIQPGQQSIHSEKLSPSFWPPIVIHNPCKVSPFILNTKLTFNVSRSTGEVQRVEKREQGVVASIAHPSYSHYSSRRTVK
jgi:hypothetical protein